MHAALTRPSTNMAAGMTHKVSLDPEGAMYVLSLAAQAACIGAVEIEPMLMAYAPRECDLGACSSPSSASAAMHSTNLPMGPNKAATRLPLPLGLPRCTPSSSSHAGCKQFATLHYSLLISTLQQHANS